MRKKKFDKTNSEELKMKKKKKQFSDKFLI